MKRYLFLFFCSILLVACNTDPAASTEALQELNFGAIGSVDVLPIVIAEENGYFSDENLIVNFESFTSANDRDAAFISGNLDGIVGDVVAISLYQNGGTDVKITGITDGDFTLVARQNAGIDQVEDLVAQQIAISNNTLIEYSLDKIIEKYNVSEDAIIKTIVPALPVRLEMLRNDQVDAALLPEPFSTLAINEGAVVLGSANEEGYNPSVSAFLQEAIEKKPEEIKSFYRAYNKAVDFLNQASIDEFEGLIIETVGYPEDMRGSIELPTFRKNALPSDKEVQDVIDWVNQKELIDKELTPNDLMDDIGI
ncbi:NitT/TauT family transport system substrate-binding protein [Natronobacillus azotifigens]|uniref:MetQ/NlpA family ABC transporter substrate-binding protein n=1 Tax=Natronobacillus azotifigens TaxID=472978 RepID=A0A9J6RBW4_9BACI|nr:ABC transporter substrate-binding protein [Natronobacillus azotifigens]MCZ0702796.1 MetQ/NlpA family ABC transporter substrate-binding protein [Natronobacillus azotifigens]